MINFTIFTGFFSGCNHKNLDNCTSNTETQLQNVFSKSQQRECLFWNPRLWYPPGQEVKSLGFRGNYSCETFINFRIYIYSSLRGQCDMCVERVKAVKLYLFQYYLHGIMNDFKSCEWDHNTYEYTLYTEYFCTLDGFPEFLSWLTG